MSFCRACDEHHSDDYCPTRQDRQFLAQINRGYTERNLSLSQIEREERERYLAEYPPQKEPGPYVLFIG